MAIEHVVEETGTLNGKLAWNLIIHCLKIDSLDPKQFSCLELGLN